MDSPPLHCFKASQGSRSAALANSSAKDFSSWQKRNRHVANSACEHARTSENTAFAFLNISKCSNFETSYTMHFTCATHEHIQQPIQPVSRDVCICVWAAWPSAPQTFEVNAACTAWASYNDGHFGWFRMISDDFGWFRVERTRCLDDLDHGGSGLQSQGRATRTSNGQMHMLLANLQCNRYHPITIFIGFSTYSS